MQTLYGEHSGKVGGATAAVANGATESSSNVQAAGA